MALEMGYTFAFYRLDTGTAAARTIEWSYTGAYDPDGVEPDSRPVPGTHYDDTVYGWMAVPGAEVLDVPDALDTDILQEARPVLDTTTGTADVVIETAPIERRQRRVRAILKEHRDRLRDLLGNSSRIKTARFAILRARLRNIEDVETAYGAWNTNPEGVLSDANFLAPEDEELEETSLAERQADILNRRSVAPEKLVPYDTSNLTPLGNFDSGLASLYEWTNLPQPTFTTATKSGGYAVEFGPRTDSAQAGILSLPYSDFAPVEEGETIVYRASWRTASLISNYTGAFQLFEVYLDETHTLVGTPTQLFTADALGWTTKEVNRVVPAGAKYAGWQLRIPSGAVAGAQIRADAVSVKKVITSDQIAVGATGLLAAVSDTSGTITTATSTATSAHIVASSGADGAIVLGRGTRKVAVMASVFIGRAANGDVVRLNGWITAQKTGGSETVIASITEWGFEEGGRKTFTILAAMANDPGGEYVFRLRIAKSGSHTGGNPTWINGSIIAFQNIT